MGHQGGVTHIQFSPNDQYLSSLGADGTVRIWSVQESRCITSKPYLDKEYIHHFSASWCENNLLAVPYGHRIDIIQVLPPIQVLCVEWQLGISNDPI